MNPPPRDTRPVDASTAAIETLAAEWVVRRDNGLDEAGKAELAGWLSSSPAHQHAFARLAGTWDVFGRAAQRGETSEIVTRLAVRARQRRRTRRHWAAVGSAVAITLVVFLRPSPTPIAPAVTPVAIAVAFEHLQKLPDGTLVELNQDAEISVQYEPGVRRVQLLRGEALFRVQKDAARPFLVRAGAIEVRAVGTAFNVQFQPTAVEVLVTEGKVRVTDVAKGSSLLPSGREGGTQPLDLEGEPLLVAGERAQLDPRQPERLPPSGVVALTPDQIEERLAWRIPLVKFSSTPLAEAIPIFNRQNLLQISFRGAEISTLRISGSFRADNPEGFVRLLEETFGLVALHPAENELILTTSAPASRGL